MPKLNKIFTRTGDDGTTGLVGGDRVAKDSVRVNAYGTLDELTSHIGLALAHGLSERLIQILPAIQNELFNLGSELASPTEDIKNKFNVPRVGAKQILQLEAHLKELNDIVGPLENFVLPGGSVGAAQLHVARTVCRRAERECLTLAHTEPISDFAIPYLNRLSDFLFVAARYENKMRGAQEPLWDKNK